MIRVLFIGRPANAWAQRIETSAFSGVEAVGARLPAAGVRQLETTPPDVVVLVDENSAKKPITLVSAIQERPLGSLTPIFLVCPDDASEAQRASLDIEGWLTPDTSVDALMTAISDALGLEAWELETTEAAQAQDVTAALDDEDDFELEEIPEESGPRRLASREIFGERYVQPDDDEVSEDELRRKLRSVRHEDYFSILEVPRGAETQTIRDAFHRMNSRWSPKMVEFDLTHRFHAELAEIRDAFEDAWAVLGDPRLRGAYLQQTTRK